MKINRRLDSDPAILRSGIGPKSLIGRFLSAALLVTLAATGVAMRSGARASAASGYTLPYWEPGEPSCVNTANGELDFYATHLAGGARACRTGATRVFHATSNQSVWLDVTVKRWTLTSTNQWNKSVDQQTRYKATCSASYNPAVLNVDNGDCVGSDSDTRWHGPYSCWEYAGLNWCGDIWPNADTDFTMAGGSIYSVEQTLTWWNASVLNRMGRLGVWQYQTKTWWLNTGGLLYAQSLSSIQTIL